MSSLYHRQVAPTRSRGTTIEKVTLTLPRSQLNRLILLVEADIAEKKKRRVAGELDLGLEASCLIRDELKRQ